MKRWDDRNPFGRMGLMYVCFVRLAVQAARSALGTAMPHEAVGATRKRRGLYCHTARAGAILGGQLCVAAAARAVIDKHVLCVSAVPRGR